MTSNPDMYGFARFLLQAREAAGLNHQQLADKLKAHGRNVSYQSIQQWENTNPAYRTTWPKRESLAAIAKALRAPLPEVETAWVDSRAAKATTMPRQTVSRGTRSSLEFGRLHAELHAAILARIPDAEGYIEKAISPFGIKRRFDYLSPNAAVEWAVISPNPPYIKRMALESMLWRLMWLSRLDSELSTSRQYAVFLVIPDEDNEDEQVKMKAVKAALDELGNEIRLFSDFNLTVGLAMGAESLAEMVEEAEQQGNKGAHTPAKAARA